MNIYCAGKTQNWRQVRVVQDLVRTTGHKITYDWTANIVADGGDSEEVGLPAARRSDYALMDMGGVYKADILIALGHPNLCGTLWECGMAAAWGKNIWLVEWQHSRPSVFDHLPMVKKVPLMSLGVNLCFGSEKKLSLTPPRVFVEPDGSFRMEPAVERL